MTTATLREENQALRRQLAIEIERGADLREALRRAAGVCKCGQPGVQLRPDGEPLCVRHALEELESQS